MPVASPIAARSVIESKSKSAIGQRAIVEAAGIFFPSGLMCILRKMTRANEMVLALHHAAQPREIGLNEIGVNAVERIRERMIDPLRIKFGVKRVPVASLIGNHCAAGLHGAGRDIDAMCFA